MDRREAIKQSALLMGVTMSGAVFSGMLNGCTVDTSDDYQPLVFSRENFRLITAMCDLIMPTTDTPGALDLYVDRLVDELASNSFNAEILERTQKGMDELRAQLDENLGSSFLDASPEEQEEALRVIDNDISNNEIYRSLKGIIIFGYFSSEEVGENIMSYDPIPGKFVGCAPASDVGNAWSLR